MPRFFKNKKILVTGGTGFIGASLVQRLLDEEARVRATLHRRAPVIRDDRIEYVPCDLSLFEDCLRIVQGVDILFMCAANTSGAAVMSKTPLVHVTPNIVMNARLLEAAHKAGVGKTVFLSSSAAYPPTGERPVVEDEMFAGDPPDVYYPVGWMKRYTEILCRMYSEKISPPMPCVVVRPSNIFGPLDDFDPATSHMMAALIRRTVERENPFVVWGAGKDIRDLLYIDDFLDGLLLAAEKLETYDPVNIAMGKGHSIREILDLILRADGFAGADIRFDAAKPSMFPVRLVDTARARRLLGFAPRTTLDEGIRKTLAWYRMNGSAGPRR